MERKCSNCGAIIQYGNTVCLDCGEIVPEVEELEEHDVIKEGTIALVSAVVACIFFMVLSIALLSY